MNDHHDRTARALGFGGVAELYDRRRPRYPAQIVDLACGVAVGPIADALEIGAGTGLATEVIAGAGIAVTAVEPDPGMLAVLRRRCAGLPVTAVEATFEDPAVAGLGPVDLVYAGAALHWTAAQGRWDRVSALLRPGGAVMTMGGSIVPADPDVRAAQRATIDRILGDVPAPGPVNGDGPPWPSDELLADDRFTEVSHLTIERRHTTTIEAWLEHLRAVSTFTVLTVALRAEVFDALRVVLPAEFVVDADLVVHTARRC